MAEVLQNVEESGLCDKCSVLRFDDAKFGGYQAEGKAGQNVLRFGEDDIDDRKRELILDYTQDDLLPELPHLKASKEADCAFCGALCDATLRLGFDKPGLVTYKLRYLWRPILMTDFGLYMLLADLTVRLDDSTSTEEPIREESLVFLVDCEGACMNWLQTMQSPRQEALCNENIVWMAKELDRSNNERGQFPASDFLPTRLLDLGTGDTEDCIRLIQTSDTQLLPPVRYATLSYCWGSKEEAALQIKTTALTLERYLEHIPFDSMTRVIQDAVKVARSLSLRYLWIDALCICQGPQDDWMKESERMGLIYANAYVTICTLATSSCVEGFLGRTQPIRVNFQSTIRPDIRGRLNIRHMPQMPGFQYIYASEPMTMDRRCGQWQDRAWTLQEEQLSTRLLYFGLSRIYISCSERDLQEPGQETTFGLLQHFSYELQNYTRDRNVQALYSTWRNLVEEYSSRQSTNQRDKFPAISGLAKLMAAETGDEYIAGFWKSDIVRALLWKTYGNNLRWSEICGRPPFSSVATYISPTWSWARNHEVRDAVIFDTGVKGGVDEYGFRSECKSVTTWCVPEDRDLNPYGRIVDARLKVRGKLLKVTMPWKRTSVMAGNAFIDWKTTFGDSHVALCDLDWAVEADVQVVHREEVHMLLLGSTLGRLKASRRQYLHLLTASEPNPLTDQNDVGNDDGGEALEQPGHHEDAQVDLDVLHTSGISNDRDSPIGSPQERALRDRDVDITLGHTENTERNAWGLLIARVDGEDKYVRVGRFQVWVQRGGLDAFRSYPYRNVEII